MARKSKRKINKLIWLGLVFLVVGLLASVFWAYKNVPNPKRLATADFPESTIIYDRNGKELYEIFEGRSRVPVTLSQIPKTLISATLAIEDANFYSHFGFDLKGLMRGLYRTVIERRPQGGSTLTQQLVKNALLDDRSRTISRKIKEAVATIATEMLYSKDQILEMYFNQIPYGGTLWGAEAASQSFFGKSVSQLDLAQSALLAGLPASPTKYSPGTYPEKAKNRQVLVLQRMRELKMITEEEYNKALEEPLVYSTTSNDIRAPHFVFYLRDKLYEDYGVEKVQKGGLKVVSTLDLDMQTFAENQVKTEMDKLVKLGVSNGAALITEPKSGQILAMVGSKDYFDDTIGGKFNVTTAQRQPGSSIKPLTYGLALEMGKITPASMYMDEETCFEVPGQKKYCPNNYGNHYFGLQPVRNSLANSLNIAAVKTMKLVGVEAMVASSSAFGIDSWKKSSDYGLSLTLGGGEVAMTEMNTLYGVFANGGVRQDLNPILKVSDKKGQVIEAYEFVPGERVMSRESAFLISNILADDGARSMVFGSGGLLKIKGHPEVSVKTGTTNDLRDNWTFGYTQDFVVGVWVGNNNNKPMSRIVSGVTGAAPIWNKIMTGILKDQPVKKMTQPTDIVTKLVCNLTGMLPPPEGCETKNEYFNKLYVPTASANIKKTVLVDKTTNKLIKEGENNPNAEWQEKQILVDASGATVCLDCSK